MPWINDVVPYTTILSTWGNNMRNHVVHQFADKTERDSQGHPVEGMLCQTAADNAIWVYIDGAWHVESMPYKPFTPRVWVGGSGPSNEIGVQSAVGWWTNHRGLCQAQLQATVDLTQFQSIPVWVYPLLPVQASVAGLLGGTAMFVQASTNLTSGGGASWVDNIGAQSRAIINNLGPGVPPNAQVTVPPGNTKITVFYSVSYQCPPTADTAP